MLILSGEDVARLLEPVALTDAMEAAFVELSAGRTEAPNRISAGTPSGGALLAMPGYVGRALGAKLITWFGDNPAHGLPAAQGLIALFGSDDGRPLCVLDGTEITARRTAAATAVAARHLARRGAPVLAVVGAGVQGETHLAHVRQTREFREVRVASRDARRARVLAERHGARACSAEEAVRGADVVCLCTHSSAPVIDHAWLAPGALVTSVGWAGSGSELDSATIAAARLFVESRSAFEPYPAGAIELQGADPAGATELGEVVTGSRPGRLGDDELLLYKSTGHAVEDAAAAWLAYERALAAGTGTSVRI